MNEDDYEYGDGVCLDCGLIWAEHKLKGTVQMSGGCFRCGSFNWEFRPVGGPNDYVDDLGQVYKCTCTPECVQPCKGGCGCVACGTSYSDFYLENNNV